MIPELFHLRLPDTADNTPLFNGFSDLAREIGRLPYSGYLSSQMRSLSTFISQIELGKRPCPKRLAGLITKAAAGRLQERRVPKAMKEMMIERLKRRLRGDSLDASCAFLQLLDSELNARITMAIHSQEQRAWWTEKIRIKQELAAARDEEIDRLAYEYLARLVTTPPTGAETVGRTGKVPADQT